jgi:hypothetical protein
MGLLRKGGSQIVYLAHRGTVWRKRLGGTVQLHVYASVSESGSVWPVSLFARGPVLEDYRPITHYTIARPPSD